MMQFDRNRQAPISPRHTRTPIGRSCPTSACGTRGDVGDLPERDIPQVDDRIGDRLCDGSMPRGDRKDDMNGCGNEGGWGLTSYPLAMVYSPLQEFRDVYAPDVALERGTIFPELDLPFEGYKGKKGGFCK